MPDKQKASKHFLKGDQYCACEDALASPSFPQMMEQFA
jgi:hypothetical protein